MNWEQWLSANQMNIDFGESSVDLMRRAYIAGLAKVHDLREPKKASCEGREIEIDGVTYVLKEKK